MKFREIREVKKEERIKIQKEENNYLKIKPTTDMTTEEAMDFWKNEFGF